MKLDSTSSKNSPAGTCVIGEADPFLSQLLQRFVEKSGLHVRLAQSGEALLASVFEDRPAVIICEPELPGMLRGWEAVQRLSTNEDTRAIPIILCAWLNETEAQALVGQALNHLQKPDLHYNDFVKALSEVGITPTP